MIGRPALRLAAIAAVLGPFLIAAAADAHRLAPALLELVETTDGEVEVLFKTPLQQPVGSEVRPVLPAHCRRVGTGEALRDAASVTLVSRVDCGSAGLVGSEIAVQGLDAGGANALLRIALRDGRRWRAVLHAEAPRFAVPERQSAVDVARDYAALGVGHILGGLDHLAFVLGLVLLVTGGRRLLSTVTAFTLGHSVTLCLAALGFVDFPSALVELAIALTILVLALELARPVGSTESALRRFPWLMAFGFGLLHGLGFAGALSEVGLPADEIPLALLAFNVGIEVGQLAFVGVVLALGGVIRPAAGRLPVWLLRAPAHAMGGLAVYWCLDRGLGLG